MEPWLLEWRLVLPVDIDIPLPTSLSNLVRDYHTTSLQVSIDQLDLPYGHPEPKLEVFDNHVFVRRDGRRIAFWTIVSKAGREVCTSRSRSGEGHDSAPVVPVPIPTIGWRVTGVAAIESLVIAHLVSSGKALLLVQVGDQPYKPLGEVLPELSIPSGIVGVANLGTDSIVIAFKLGFSGVRLLKVSALTPE